MCSRQAGQGQPSAIGSREPALNGLGQVEAEAVAGVRNQRSAVAAEPGRGRAVEGVDAGRDGAEDVVHVADAQQVPGCLVGQAPQRPADHGLHLLLGLAERAAYRYALGRGRRHALGRLRPQVLVHPALDDAHEQLLGLGVLAPPAHAAVQPAVGPLHGAGGVVAVGVRGRALVEGQRDVRAQLRLDLHRGLGAHEALGAVEVGAKEHALLGYVEHLALVVRAAALDLVGHRAVAQREDLKAARVGDDRPPPAHELVQAAHLGDVLAAGADEQVEGVAEDHVVAQLGHLRGVQGLDRPGGGQRHEGRGAHLTVGQTTERPRGRSRRGRRCGTRAPAGA